MAADQITALGVEGFEKMKKRYAKAQELARQLAEERKKLANEAARIGGEELLKQLEDEDGGVSLLTWWAWHANVAISGKAPGKMLWLLPNNQLQGQSAVVEAVPAKK